MVVSSAVEYAPSSGSHTKVQVFLDSANLSEIVSAFEQGIIQGVTTNPSLMRKAGITDYEKFSRELLQAVPSLPISLEVFSDEEKAMEWEAKKIASWGSNVYVKVPVTNTKGKSTAPLIRTLTQERIPVNITALFTLRQLEQVLPAIAPETPAIFSFFAGRIANTGLDPVPLLQEAARRLKSFPNGSLLWASAREILNIKQAEAAGCQIITLPLSFILDARKTFGKDLDEYSLETVQMFYNDARAAGYSLY
jgi:transaldolase